MTTYVALLRAVNVGGTGKLPMAELAAMGRGCGFEDVRTYIASGNLIFSSEAGERDVQSILEGSLAAYAGKRIGVLIRTAEEIKGVVAGNPFTDEPGNRVTAIFLDVAPPPDAAARARNLAGERIALDRREIYVCYGEVMASSRLVIPDAREGTARNLNTVRKLAELTRDR